MQDLFESAGLVRSVAFTGDGKFLIAATTAREDDKDEGAIRLWDIKAATTRPSIALDGDPFAMAVAPDGQSLAVAIARDTKAARTHVHPRRQRALREDDEHLDAQPRRRRLVTGLHARRKSARRRNRRPARLALLRRSPASGTRRPVRKSDRSRATRTRSCRSRSLMTAACSPVPAEPTVPRPGKCASGISSPGRLLHTLVEPDLAIVTVAFSPDDKTVASGGTIWRDDRRLRRGWSRSGTCRPAKNESTLPAFPSYVHAVSFAPAGARLATASVSSDNDAKVTIWNSDDRHPASDAAARQNDTRNHRREMPGILSRRPHPGRRRCLRNAPALVA